LGAFRLNFTVLASKIKMHDSNDRFKAPMTSSNSKRLGGYLVEAGLITPAQVDVALNDQKIMDGMRFGEVLSARGMG
jgi:hypothetical protein